MSPQNWSKLPLEEDLTSGKASNEDGDCDVVIAGVETSMGALVMYDFDGG